jgi:hypothetical protein
MEYFACKELTQLGKSLLETIHRRDTLAFDLDSSEQLDKTLLLIHAKISAHRNTCVLCNSNRAVRAPSGWLADIEDRTRMAGQRL